MKADPFRVIDVRAGAPDADVLDEIAAHLRRGGLIAYPTETVYGFGCLLRDDALEALARLKERDGDRPFLLLVPGEEATSGLRWTGDAREMASVFWPGALTLVLDDPDRRYPERVRGPGGGVAVRRTPHPVAGALVDALGEPLTSTSANRPGAEPATTAEEAAEAAEAVLTASDVAHSSLWILDGGRLPPSAPSTVLDMTRPDPRILREGAVPASRLGCVKAVR